MADLGSQHQLWRRLSNAAASTVSPRRRPPPSSTTSLRGVSKASGLEYAIEVLGRSPHTALAMGDAENDLSMLLKLRDRGGGGWVRRGAAGAR